MVSEDMKGEEFIALFTDSKGEKINVEAGAAPPTDLELENSEFSVVHYVGVDGEDVYFSVLGGFDATFTPWDAIDEVEGTTSRSGKSYPSAYPGEQ
jgi:hypothetical protein